MKRFSTKKILTILLAIFIVFPFAMPTTLGVPVMGDKHIAIGATQENIFQKSLNSVQHTNSTLENELIMSRLWQEMVEGFTVNNVTLTQITLSDRTYLEYSSSGIETNTYERINNVADVTTYGTSDIDIWVDAPAYWERGEYITIYVHFRNNGWQLFRYSGTIYCYLKDIYYEVPGGYWVTERTASKSVSFALLPFYEQVISISFYAPFTTPGLKKLVVVITGSYSKTIDLGYNFVQKYQEGELGTPDNLAPSEDPMELSDLHHWNDWVVIKRAGAAGDCWRQDATPIDVGFYVMRWVSDHFIYDENYESVPLLYYIASDLWLITHIDSNGYFHGVCSEFAVMFTSLARALNIPARLIVGYVASGSHAFNEFWDGSRWVHADALWYQDDPSAFDNPSIYLDNDWIFFDIRIFQDAFDANYKGDDDAGYTWGILAQEFKPDGDIGYAPTYPGPNTYTYS